MRILVVPLCCGGVGVDGEDVEDIEDPGDTGAVGEVWDTDFAGSALYLGSRKEGA